MRRLIHLVLLTTMILWTPSVLVAAVDSLTSKLEPSPKPSLDELRANAEKGDGKAQWQLAWAYHVGRGVTKDESVAWSWWQKATESLRKLAEQGDAIAQGLLGDSYLRGFGVPRDHEEALKWLRSAAEKDDMHAIRLLIMMYSDTSFGVPEDPAEVSKLENKEVGLYRRAADRGDADAMYLLAKAFTYGRGVPKDNAEALKWLRQAGEHENVIAQADLGELYLRGKEVPQDKAESAKWYKRAAIRYREAAERGDTDAQFSYGQMQENIAKAWFRSEGTFNNSLENREAAFWFLKAAYKGHRLAQLHLSYQYTFGAGVPKSEVEGTAWEIIYVAGEQDDDLKEEAMDELKRTELFIGPDKMRMAKQRSKEILAEIEATNARNGAGKALLENGGGRGNAPKASGSGTIVSSQGLVLTAAHVVAGANAIKVITAQGIRTATVLRVDESNDVAILKIDKGSFVPLPIAPSRKIRLGQGVATIGFPNVQIQGFSPKVTRGEISSLNGMADDPRSWQISVPVQPGNSGGPLLDENGNLIGIVVSKLGMKAAEATGDMPQNVNYAVKSAYALALLEPYLNSDAPEPSQTTSSPRLEDMAAKAQQSVVLILVY